MGQPTPRPRPTTHLLGSGYDVLPQILYTLPYSENRVLPVPASLLSRLILSMFCRNYENF